MKKPIFLFAFAIVYAVTGNAQTTGKYADLILFPQFFKNQYFAELHAGGDNDRKHTLIRDSDGHKKLFASEVDALNYVCSQGWELVSTHSEHGGGIHYILKK